MKYDRLFRTTLIPCFKGDATEVFVSSVAKPDPAVEHFREGWAVPVSHLAEGWGVGNDVFGK